MTQPSTRFEFYRKYLEVWKRLTFLTYNWTQNYTPCSSPCLLPVLAYCYWNSLAGLVHTGLWKWLGSIVSFDSLFDQPILFKVQLKAFKYGSLHLKTCKLWTAMWYNIVVWKCLPHCRSGKDLKDLLSVVSVLSTLSSGNDASVNMSITNDLMA